MDKQSAESSCGLQWTGQLLMLANLVAVQAFLEKGLGVGGIAIEATTDEIV